MQPKVDKVSLIFPVFDEAGNIEELFKRLEQEIFQSDLVKCWELVFVDDGSVDESAQLIEECFENLQRESVSLRLLTFSRNFGHQLAITAGIDASSGTFVAILDADLQDPPEVVLEMLDIALSGYDVVSGSRRARSGETTFKKVSASVFYRLLRYLSDVDIPVDTGDFRLMSRSFVNEFVKLRERHRFVRGMVPWLGFRTTTCEFDRESRFSGDTKYPLKKMIGLALTGILSFSIKPLELAFKMGLAISTIATLGIFYIVYAKIFTDEIIEGWATITCSLCLFGGMQLLFLGLIGEYVGRIYEEIKGRPLYVVSKDIQK